MIDLEPWQVLASTSPATDRSALWMRRSSSTPPAGKRARLPVAQACNSDWLFIPQPPVGVSASLVDPAVTTQSCTPGAIIYQPLLGDTLEADFAALPIGDCTGNWAGSRGAFRRRTDPPSVWLGAPQSVGRRRWTVGCTSPVRAPSRRSMRASLSRPAFVYVLVTLGAAPRRGARPSRRRRRRPARGGVGRTADRRSAAHRRPARLRPG